MKSAVGLSRSRSTTDKSAPFTWHNWLIAAPPALKFKTIWAVTSWGNGLTFCAQTPWFPANTTACACAIRGTSTACHPAKNTARSSRRPKEPAGLVKQSCRARAAAWLLASVSGRCLTKVAMSSRLVRRKLTWDMVKTFMRCEW